MTTTRAATTVTAVTAVTTALGPTTATLVVMRSAAEVARDEKEEEEEEEEEEVVEEEEVEEEEAEGEEWAVLEAGKVRDGAGTAKVIAKIDRDEESWMMRRRTMMMMRVMWTAIGPSMTLRRDPLLLQTETPSAGQSQQGKQVERSSV